MEKIVNLSEKVIKRLTLYHAILLDYKKQGLHYISSPQIASLLSIDDSQVRKDINLLNNIGKCKVGYDVCDLVKSIEKTLGFKKPKSAFIVGAGNLGIALAKYDNFANYGLNVLSLFDNDPLKIGIKINDKEVYHISKINDFAKKMGVEIVILTVPKDCANSVCKIFDPNQIKYIWNFTPKVLNLPKEIQVWNENLMGSFLQFAYKLQ